MGQQRRCTSQMLETLLVHGCWAQHRHSHAGCGGVEHSTRPNGGSGGISGSGGDDGGGALGSGGALGEGSVYGRVM